jgi:hypothetical protein
MIRSTFIVLAACVFLAGCDDTDSPTSPSNQPLVFSALLQPANEVPPVGNAESGGRGAVQVTFNTTRDANNNITAATATFYFQLTAFPNGTTLVGAHIHPGVAGMNGPVVISTGLTATNTVSLPNGVNEFTFSNINVDPALVQAIANNPSAYYFNTHSPLNPGGFSRGQLTRVQ